MQNDHILKTLNFNQVRGQCQGRSDHKMVRDTPPSHQIWDSYLNQNRRYALDIIILEYGHVKVTVLNTPPSQDASICMGFYRE